MFFRNTMMSDKKTVKELKEASKKPFLLLREDNTQEGQGRSGGNALSGRKSLTDTV